MNRAPSRESRPGSGPGHAAVLTILFLGWTVGCSATSEVEIGSTENDLARSTRFVLDQFAGDPEALARSSRRFARTVAEDSATTLDTIGGAPAKFRDGLAESSRATAENVAGVAESISKDVERFPDRFRRFLRLIL